MGQELRLNFLFTIAAVAANVWIDLTFDKFIVGEDVDGRSMRLLLERFWISMDLVLRPLWDHCSLLLGLYYLVLDRKVVAPSNLVDEQILILISRDTFSWDLVVPSFSSAPCNCPMHSPETAAKSSPFSLAPSTPHPAFSSSTV